MKQGEELNESNKWRIMTSTTKHQQKNLPNPAFPPLTERAEAEQVMWPHVEPSTNSDVCHTLRMELQTLQENS